MDFLGLDFLSFNEQYHVQMGLDRFQSMTFCILVCLKFHQLNLSNHINHFDNFSLHSFCAGDSYIPYKLIHVVIVNTLHFGFCARFK